MKQCQVLLPAAAAAAAKLLRLCPTLCDPIDSSPPGLPSLGFSRQERWSGLPFPSPMHESEKWKWSRSVVSDSNNPTDCSPPGSSVHGIFQAKERGAIASSLKVCSDADRSNQSMGSVYSFAFFFLFANENQKCKCSIPIERDCIKTHSFCPHTQLPCTFIGFNHTGFMGFLPC